MSTHALLERVRGVEILCDPCDLCFIHECGANCLLKKSVKKCDIHQVLGDSMFFMMNRSLASVLIAKDSTL